MSLLDRIKALEALRRERAAKLQRSIDPVARAVRWANLAERCRYIDDGSFLLTEADYRAKRCAELFRLAQQRMAAATFSDIA